MDVIEFTAAALAHCPLVTAAGLCERPQVLSKGEAEGDTDIFVFCREVPPANERRALFPRDSYTAGRESGHWGVCDLVILGGGEVWLMYLTEGEALAEAESVLAGKLPRRLDNYYYPTGRLASIRNMQVLFDKNGFIARLKALADEYPESLARTLFEYHKNALLDTEDLERAAARGDVLFYHFALDLAIDHFLQALFALNREFFPSRKRSLNYIEGFNVKPEGCELVLINAVKLEGGGELEASLCEIRRLIEWTRERDV